MTGLEETATLLAAAAVIAWIAFEIGLLVGAFREQAHTAMLIAEYMAPWDGKAERRKET